MLKQLYIKNYTLIDTLDIVFRPGFSVITGETGAGKSIILGAISLLLGQRADSKTIKNGTNRCIIEAHFDLSNYDTSSFFTDNDIEYDAEDCILRRELTSSGKSRAFINDTPVSLNQLRTLGQQLVDIHSQHQNLLLQEEDFQLNVVDIIAKNKQRLNECKQQFKAYQQAKKAVEDQEERIARTRENEDFLRFQLNELADARLQAGIQEELERNSETMSHAEEIKSALYESENILSGNEHSILTQMKDSSRLLDDIRKVYPDIGECSDRLASCYIELKDISQELYSHTQNIDYDPKELEAINEQLDHIYSLEKKHHVQTVEELIEIQNEISRQLDQIENSDEELEELRNAAQERLNECLEVAEQLSEHRKAAIKSIEKEMVDRLVALGIPHVRFQIKMEDKELQADGTDRISFMFSANTSTAMQPIKEVASGGEIARVMLSLKAMISGAVKLPTIIFDEIDTGVSGKIAERMADIMKEMGQHNRQVISITHLPQIAASGSSHYKVFKEEGDKGTISRMCELNKDERVMEIAQMLSGADITKAAKSQAQELLKQKQNRKE